MNSNRFSEPGDTITYTVRSITITLQITVDGGYTRNVFAGPTRVNELAKGYTDRNMARAQARQLAIALKGGANVWQVAEDQFRDERQVLATADEILDAALQTACAAPVTPQADAEIANLQQYKTDDAESDEIAARVRAGLDAAAEIRRAEARKLNDAVERIMAGSRGFRGDRPTNANVVAKPVPTASERALLAAAATPTKTLHRNAQCTIGQITALFNRGLATPIRTKVGNRWTVTGMRLTIAGEKLAARLNAELTA